MAGGWEEHVASGSRSLMRYGQEVEKNFSGETLQHSPGRMKARTKRSVHVSIHCAECLVVHALRCRSAPVYGPNRWTSNIKHRYMWCIWVCIERAAIASVQAKASISLGTLRPLELFNPIYQTSSVVMVSVANFTRRRVRLN